MSESKTLLDLVEKHARSVLACVGIVGCVAIYADFRCVVDKQLTGYDRISSSIAALTAEIKKTEAAVRENSIRLEHLEREHEKTRNSPQNP